MPSYRGTWWHVSPDYPRRAGPDRETLRPCGCHVDPVVFGHWHHTAPGGAR